MIPVLVAIVIVATPRGKDEEAKGRRKGCVRGGARVCGRLSFAI